MADGCQYCRSFVVARESIAPNARDHPTERSKRSLAEQQSSVWTAVRPVSSFYLSTTVRCQAKIDILRKSATQPV